MERKEFEKMIKKGQDFYKIIYIDGTNYPNSTYNSYWAWLSAGNKFYYVEYSINHMLNNENDITITLYNKISANEKQQAGYSENVENIEDIIKYIEKTKNIELPSVHGACVQKIFYELSTIVDGKTIKQHLKDQCGYREKAIINDLQFITKEEASEGYNILKFEDSEGNFFEINTKNVNRLIVG